MVSPTQNLWLPHLMCTLTSAFNSPWNAFPADSPHPLDLTSPMEPDWSFLLPIASPWLTASPSPCQQGNLVSLDSRADKPYLNLCPPCLEVINFPVAQQGNNGVYLARLSERLRAHCMQGISAQMPSVVPGPRDLHLRASTPSFIIVLMTV